MTEEIIERLRSLDLSDGGSHSRLSAIASCFLEPAFGWTRGACEELRNMLIKLLEDADGNDDNDYAHDCSCTNHSCDKYGRQVSYDELVNERHKAVCRLRNMQMDTGNAIKKLAVALGLEWNPNNAPKSVALLQNRIIHLLGGDECNFSGVESYMDAMGEKSNPAEMSDASTDHVSFDTRLKLKTYAYIILEFADILGIDYPNGSKITDVAAEIRKRLSVLMSERKVMGFAKSAEIAKPESEDGGEVTITDELRKWANDNTIKNFVLTTYPEQHAVRGILEQLIAIADRIDEQFDRICEQQEAVLQQTIDEMTELREHDAEYALAERDELQEKCDRLKTKVEHQREQLAVYATMCDFDAVRALKRERNEHKHRADNAEGHVKSLERRLDAAHETYCALLNDAAREFRAMTAERDERYQLLLKDANGEDIHIGDVMDCGKHFGIQEVEGFIHNAVAFTVCDPQPARICTCPAHVTRHYHKPTVEQVIRDLTLGKITEAQAIERIEGINGQG